MMFESEGNDREAPVCYPCKRKVTCDCVKLREVDGALQIHVRGLGTIYLYPFELDAIAAAVVKFYAPATLAQAAPLHGGPPR